MMADARKIAILSIFSWEYDEQAIIGAVIDLTIAEYLNYSDFQKFGRFRPSATLKRSVTIMRKRQIQALLICYPSH
jgi:hypothetical protein